HEGSRPPEGDDRNGRQRGHAEDGGGSNRAARQGHGLRQVRSPAQPVQDPRREKRVQGGRRDPVHGDASAEQGQVLAPSRLRQARRTLSGPGGGERGWFSHAASSRYRITPERGSPAW